MAVDPMMNRDLDDEPWPSRPVHRAGVPPTLLDEDGNPLPARPWEPPGPPPRRGITFKRPMVILVGAALVAFLALTLLIFMGWW